MVNKTVSHNIKLGKTTAYINSNKDKSPINGLFKADYIR